MKPHEAVQLYFDRAADLLELSPALRKLLVIPQREVQVQIPVEMDDGRLETTDFGLASLEGGDVEIARPGLQA